MMMMVMVMKQYELAITIPLVQGVSWTTKLL